MGRIVARMWLACGSLVARSVAHLWPEIEPAEHTQRGGEMMGREVPAEEYRVGVLTYRKVCTVCSPCALRLHAIFEKKSS